VLGWVATVPLAADGHGGDMAGARALLASEWLCFQVSPVGSGSDAWPSVRGLVLFPNEAAWNGYTRGLELLIRVSLCKEECAGGGTWCGPQSYVTTNRAARKEKPSELGAALMTKRHGQ